MKSKALIFASVLFAPAFALAAAPRTFHELANKLVTIIDSATGVLIVAGIVIYFFGVSTGLMSKGEDTQSKLRTYLLWGVITLFIMVSVWGILRLLQNTLFMGDPYSPNVGTPATGNSFNAPRFAE